MGTLAGIARREKKRAAMEPLDAAEISVAGGVANDSRGKPGKRQVTLLAQSAWHAACAELGEDVPWTARRANLLIADMELPKEAGHIVQIGAVRLRTMIEIDPCSRMDEAAPGLKEALQPEWRGGVGCEVLEGGRVCIGDAVSISGPGA